MDNNRTTILVLILALLFTWQPRVIWAEESDKETADAAQKAADKDQKDEFDLSEVVPPWEAGPLTIGGAVRVNYLWKSWDEAEDQYKDEGDVDYDTAYLNVDFDSDPWIASGQYRYYRYEGGEDSHFIHHGWLGYRFDDENQVQAGVNQVPFGLLPYASHNWFFQFPYYVGLEDDYDLGLKYIREQGPWNLQFGYYPTDEGDGHGVSNDSARYSYDLAKEGLQRNKERHQVNARVAYTFEHGESSNTEVGFSGQYGLIRNDITHRDGARYAFGPHLEGNYGRWNVKLEAIRSEYEPKNPAGQSRDFVLMGAYDFPYRVASKSNMYVAGISYRLPVERWGVDAITFYDDYSYMDKRESDYSDTAQNVVGTRLDVGKFLIYVDAAMGRNHPWLGPGWTEPLASGSDNDWHTRFNVNVGLYF